MSLNAYPYADSVARYSALRYIVVGGLGFFLDFAIIVGLHSWVGMGLWVATSVGFWSGLAFCFSMQRLVMLRSTGRWQVHLVRYTCLLAVNYVLTLLLVSSTEAIGLGFETGKVIAGVLLTIWTHCVYRWWVFASEEPSRSLADALSLYAQERA